jgi:hypothetical protein
MIITTAPESNSHLDPQVGLTCLHKLKLSIEAVKEFMIKSCHSLRLGDLEACSGSPLLSNRDLVIRDLNGARFLTCELLILF